MLLVITFENSWHLTYTWNEQMDFFMSMTNGWIPPDCSTDAHLQCSVDTLEWFQSAGTSTDVHSQIYNSLPLHKSCWHYLHSHSTPSEFQPHRHCINSLPATGSFAETGYYREHPPLPHMQAVNPQYNQPSSTHITSLITWWQGTVPSSR